MKKPYIKKIGRFSGYNVWYVNGYKIRNHLDRTFPNYGGHRNFVFIPKDEFWIDYAHGKKEAKYFIDMFLAMEKAYADGKNNAEAIEIANRIEKAERGKSKFIKRLKKIRLKEKLLKRIHKKQLFSKYTNLIDIWRIRGNIVRSLFDVDFNQGGHDKLYSYIPENEIWIDDNLYKKEVPFVLVHELHERNLMAKGWAYDTVGSSQFVRKKQGGKKSAHFEAEDLEFWCRKHPKSVKRIILKEIKKNERITKKLDKEL